MIYCSRKLPCKEGSWSGWTSSKQGDQPVWKTYLIILGIVNESTDSMETTDLKNQPEFSYCSPAHFCQHNESKWSVGIKKCNEEFSWVPHWSFAQWMSWPKISKLTTISTLTKFIFLFYLVLWKQWAIFMQRKRKTVLCSHATLYPTLQSEYGCEVLQSDIWVVTQSPHCVTLTSASSALISSFGGSPSLASVYRAVATVEEILVSFCRDKYNYNQ